MFVVFIGYQSWNQLNKYFSQSFVLFSPAPPSYEECVFGTTNIRDTDDTDFTFGSATYAPKYTYYKWT